MAHPLPLKQLRQLALHLRTHIIFGCNTDVGKTICSAGLVRSSGGSHYIKPLQCGGSDQNFIERHLDSLKDDVELKTLFRWNTPASPHTASILEDQPKSDEEVLSAVQAALMDSRTATSTVWLETAGGVLSPSSASPKNMTPRHASTNSWGWTTQADLYQSLIEISSVVLVGDGKLGGISATLSSLESLLLRGYNVDCIVLIESEGYDNVSALREYAKRSFKLRSGVGTSLFEDVNASIVSLPALPPEPEPLQNWYESIYVVNTFKSLNRFLLNKWAERVEKRKAYETQRTQIIEKKIGQSSNKYYQFVDSSLALISSTVIGFHGNARLPETIAGSEMDLSNALIQELSNGWASRIMFNKTTDMNVPLTIGILTYQKWHSLEKDSHSWIVATQGDYQKSSVEQRRQIRQKDTVCEEQKVLFEAPCLAYKKGELCITKPSTGETFLGQSLVATLDVESRLESDTYHSYVNAINVEWNHIERNSSSSKSLKIGSIMINPLFRGGNKFEFTDPLWQRALIDVAKSKRVPVIFNVASSSLCPKAFPNSIQVFQSDPDISAFELEGVSETFLATLTSEDVYETLQMGHEGRSLMKNYTGKPNFANCVSAIHTLQGLADTFKQDSPLLEFFDSQKIQDLSRQPMVRHCFALGNVLNIHLNSGKNKEISLSHSILASLHEQGFIVKKSENSLHVMMSPLLVTRQECDRLCSVLNDALHLFS